MVQTSYPRPMLRRSEWTTLDGEWDFALDAEGQWADPRDVKWDGAIEVPFAPETEASGVAAAGFFKACWYRRMFACASPDDDHRVLLHFGAVDYRARVWLNGAPVAVHEGGYTPFRADITGCLDASGTQELVVGVEDDPDDLAKPRGKQDWQAEPHLIWYPRTTGIWQTVWFEVVPPQRIASLAWVPDLRRWDVRVEAVVAGDGDSGLRLRVRLEVAGRVLADDTFQVMNSEVSRSIGRRWLEEDF